jgi:hypothetical protein
MNTQDRFDVELAGGPDPARVMGEAKGYSRVICPSGVLPIFLSSLFFRIFRKISVAI